MLKRSRLKLVALTIASAPVVAVLVWYAFSFLPHLGDLQSIAARGQEIRATANPAFYRLAELGETKDGIRSYAIRQAYWSLVAKANRSGNLSWHLNNLLWQVSSHIHFSENEVFGIWVECSLYGCGRGLLEASEKYFRKPINALTVDELAGLVALVRSPQLFSPATERGEERKRRILEKYHAGS